MKKLLVTLILIITAITALIYAPTSRAGDVIDYLPEMMALESWGISRIFGVRSGLGDFDKFDCYFIDRGTKLPESIHYDENGEPHTVDMLEFYHIVIECKFIFRDDYDPYEVGSDRGPRISEQEIFESAVRALNGEAVQLSNGNILDGTNQMVRAFLITDVLYFWANLVIPDPEIELTSDKELCSWLTELAVEGTTEIRFSSILMLIAIRAAEDGYIEKPCLPLLESSEEELSERAKTGDLVAAINYGIKRILRFSEEIEDIDQRTPGEISFEEYDEYFDSRLEDIGIEVLKYTEKFPLLAMTTAVSGLSFQFNVAYREYQ